MAKKGEKLSEETKAKMRAAQQRLAKDPAIRKMRSENAKKVEARKRAEEAADPELAAERAKQYSDAVKKGWKNRSRKVSKETRKKLSEANKRRYKDPKEREKTSKQFKGVKKSKEHIAKIQASRKGWKPTKEQRKNMSRAQQKLRASGWSPDRTGIRNKKLKCSACKKKFLREEVIANEGFCGECITHTKLCDCGCGEEIFRYNKDGSVRKLVDNSHGGNVEQRRTCRACKEHYDEEVIKRNNGFCDDCVTHMTWCECGCGTEMFRYNQDGSVKLYADIAHIGVARGKEHRDRWENDPEYREWYSNIKSEAAKKAFEQNPELRELRSLASIEMWENEEFREAMSQMHVERLKDPEERMKHSRPGALNPAWKGGVSHEPYGEEFNDELKEAIRARQDFVCADEDETCYAYYEELSVHHIDEDKTNNHPSNLVALCRSHHGRAHNQKARRRHEEFVRRLMQKEADS